MPRHGTCTYFECNQNLLNTTRALTKAQRNHINAYHKDMPTTFICRHSNRPTTFSRQSPYGMDFVCLCNDTFTLNSSLQRHYQLCRVARDNAVSGANQTALVNTPPAGSTGSVEPPSSSSGSVALMVPESSTPASVALVVPESLTAASVALVVPESSTAGSSAESNTLTRFDMQQVNQTIMDGHRKFVEVFSTHITTTTATLMGGITSNHMTFLQTFSKQHLELQQKVEEQHAAHQKKIEDQNMEHRRVLEEQHQKTQEQTVNVIKALGEAKREKSFTLEVTEQVLHTIQNNPTYKLTPNSE